MYLIKLNGTWAKLRQTNGNLVRYIGNSDVIFADINCNQDHILVTTNSGKVELRSLNNNLVRYMGNNDALDARWNNQLSIYLNQLNSIEALPDYFYNDLLEQFKKYLITGGMPAVLNAFKLENLFEACESVLQNLILSYHGDFAKHPVMSDVAKIGQVFNSLPAQLSRENKKFVYQLVRTGARAREYEDAIQWLVRAGLV